jgi:hypothetical protein
VKLSKHWKQKVLTSFSICFAITFLFVHSATAEELPKYDRDSFGGWSDTDRDCQNTRHELLQKLSTAVISLSQNTCRVLRGRWLDPYTGQIFLNSRELDIDHLVPLKYSWERGAHSWTSEKRIQFSNDPANLFAVQKSVNRQKAAFGPSDWLPPNIDYRCQYIRNFQKIVGLYELKQTPSELQEIQKREIKSCN